jgi:hypothetical protein
MSNRFGGMTLYDFERLETYFSFVVERHRVWEQRQQGLPGPWTADPILASRKFTNVFRVLDPGSQFIFDLEEDDNREERDVLMRLFLYRHTGRVEAWQNLLVELGDYPRVVDLDTALDAWKDYRSEGNAIFTGAYLVYPQSATPGSDKLDSIIALTKRLFDPSSPDDIVPDFLAAQTQRDRFHVLRRNKGVADFMSMQILTDWGYTRFGEDLEDEFVVPGPGARRGIMQLVVTGNQEAFLRFLHHELLGTDGVPTLNLGNSVRYPSIMDVQNTLCEFSKYVRYLDAGKAGKPYIPAHPGVQPTPRTPAHWANTTR